MKVERKPVPGGFLYIVSNKGNVSSTFVPLGTNRFKKSEPTKVLEMLKDNGGMTPDAVAKTLGVTLQRAREILSKLKRQNKIKKEGICYEIF